MAEKSNRWGPKEGQKRRSFNISAAANERLPELAGALGINQNDLMTALILVADPQNARLHEIAHTLPSYRPNRPNRPSDEDRALLARLQGLSSTELERLLKSAKKKK